MPEGVAVGERVSFEGFDGPPETVLNPKKKLWEKIAPDLRINTGMEPGRYSWPVYPDTRQLTPCCLERVLPTLLSEICFGTLNSGGTSVNGNTTLLFARGVTFASPSYARPTCL